MLRNACRATLVAGVLAAFTVACTPPPGPGNDCTLRGPGVDLSGCDLHGETFLALDLHGANFTGANLIDAHFTGIDDGTPEMVLTDISGAIFDGADLTDADFFAVDARTASFRHAQLPGLTLDLNPGTPDRLLFNNTDFTGANLSGGLLDETSINGANFTDADLTGFELSEAALNGLFIRTDLSGLTTSGVIAGLDGFFRDATMLDLEFNTMTNFLGDFRGADLTGSKLSFVTSTGSDFTDAVIRDALVEGGDFNSVNFTRTDFTGTTFSTTNPNTFSNITWADTTCPNGTVQSTPCV